MTARAGCGCGGASAGWFGTVIGGVFRVYRGVVSPVLMSSGLGRCKYLPSCSEYAEVALLRHGPVRGGWMAARRLLRCHPWAEGGLDPVPAAKPRK